MDQGVEKNVSLENTLECVGHRHWCQMRLELESGCTSS